ncbi:MAG: hypothetical protein ACFFD5_13800 [Candidatus Thorarchaeota archaeon]
MKDEKIKVQVVFIGKPKWEAGWPHFGYDNEELQNRILNTLFEAFPDVDFIVSKMIMENDPILLNEVKNDSNNVDGVIIFTIGHYGEPAIVEAGIELATSGKLTILANYIYGGDHTFTKIYANIKERNLPVYPISSQNVEDFNKPISVLVNLLKLRGKKLLVYASDSTKINWDVILGLVSPERKQIMKNYPEFMEQISKMTSDKSFEFYTDVVGLDQAHQWRKDEGKYRANLKDILNFEMIKEEPDDILKYYREVDENEAKKIMEKWIKNANEVEPTEKTILNSAKLYLAFKKLLNEKNFDIFAPDCGTFLITGKIPAYPCMAFFELSNEGIYGICESDMDSTISYVFGLYITNRPGFVSNHTLDTVNNQITYMHCVSPHKLYGLDGPPADYDIVYHGETAYLGACPRVKFPIGEIVTTIKISVFEKKIAIRTGKIIDNIVDKKGCVSKMLVESNVQKIMENYDWDTFGWHRVSFIGDWKENFIIGARLLGLDIYEEDI